MNIIMQSAYSSGVMLLALVMGCNLTLSPDEGGQIVSASGGMDCTKGACSFDIPAEGLIETFTALPDEGYVFTGWGMPCQNNTTDECVIDLNPRDAAIDYEHNLQAHFVAVREPVSTRISLGAFHSCLLHDNGTVSCWGDNGSGQLGNGTNISSATPVFTKGLSNVISIAIGSYHSCALLADETVKCWGDNGLGQLGSGLSNLNTEPDWSEVWINQPATVEDLEGVAAISMGYTHSCALLNDGTVKCWGDNEDGQLGNGSLDSSLSPIGVRGLTNVISISLGGQHSCALIYDGSVKCWGKNTLGELGIGELGYNSFVSTRLPVDVIGLSNITMISTGEARSCALDQEGVVRCWGGEWGGEPTTMNELGNVAAIYSGAWHDCAVELDGEVECWWGEAQNIWGLDWGQLGDGALVGDGTLTGLDNVSAVSLGELHSCALMNDETVKCWGDNDDGQLGNGNTVQSSLPVSILLD